MVKILLLSPPREGEVSEYSSTDYTTYDFFNYPPLGLLAIAAEVDSRHAIKVLDPVTKNMSIDDVVEEIKNYNPGVLGVSIVSRRLYPAYELFRRTKEILPETVIIAGGPHINDFPIETMTATSIDFAIAGYAETSFPQFIEALDKSRNSSECFEEIPGLFYRVGEEVRQNPQSEVPLVLDELPFPKRDLVDLSNYYTACDKRQMTTIYTSRGCPYKCTFCDVQDKTYHYRSAKSIVDEFEYILSLGIQEIHIFDDTFNMGRKRVIEMCEEILRRGVKVSWSARVRAHPFDREMLRIMQESGCIRLQCGIESLNEVSLKNMKKKVTLEHIENFFEMCKEFEIETLGYFIIGFPEEGPEYRKNFFKKIKKLKPNYIQMSVLYPLPLTPFYNDLLESGYYPKDYWADFFKNPSPDYNIPICRSAELQNELMGMLDDTYRRFYLDPKFILYDLMRNTSLKMLYRKTKLAIRLMFADSRSTQLKTVEIS